jgi:hypothetical protein
MLLLVLLLLFACYVSGLWWYIPPLRSWSINHLPLVEGQADLLVPSWHTPGGARLAPDGRAMVVGWNSEPVIWNLVTDVRLPVPVEMHSMGWLNPEQFVVRADPHYYIVEAATGAVTEAEPIPPETYLKPDGFAVIAPLLQRADAVYATQGWGGLYRLFVDVDDRWSMVVLNAYEFGLASNAEVEALLATVPYQPIARPGHETPEQVAQRLTSPDGQYIAQVVRGRAVIARPDGTPVAWAAKPGWYPDILGWAHDSSGIYFQMWIRGSSAAVLVPDKPLFKLSPLTPEEARWQAVQRGVIWLGLALLVGAGGWGLVRRRWQQWRHSEPYHEDRL